MFVHVTSALPIVCPYCVYTLAYITGRNIKSYKLVEDEGLKRIFSLNGITPLLIMTSINDVRFPSDQLNALRMETMFILPIRTCPKILRPPRISEAFVNLRMRNFLMSVGIPIVTSSELLLPGYLRYHLYYYQYTYHRSSIYLSIYLSIYDNVYNNCCCSWYFFG